MLNSKTGMLWFHFDNDPEMTLEVKIRAAAVYLKAIYKIDANFCLVSQKDLGRHQAEMGGGLLVAVKIYGKEVKVRGDRRVLPNHLFVGRPETLRDDEGGGA